MDKRILQLELDLAAAEDLIAEQNELIERLTRIIDKVIKEAE
jgi:uncharacterized coiled-coil protein SlyX